MAQSSTVRLQRCLDRLRAGEAAARGELLAVANERLQRLTRTMLGDYRGVHRWEETADVCQNALLRLNRALAEVCPPTVRDFYRLAARQIRRELVDLARHYFGPQGAGAHHASQGPAPSSEDSATPRYEPAERSTDPDRLAGWTEFHLQVEKLAEEEREVFDLLWYQGLTQADAAAVVGVTERTIKNRWRNARLHLHEALGGEMPGVEDTRMADEGRLTELLSHWERVREQGQTLPAEELCRDCPELLEEVRRRLDALRALEPVLQAPFGSKMETFCETTPSLPAGWPSFPGFEILAELGRGGMGVVYKARQTSLKRLVALKVILGGGHAGSRERSRFRAEAEAVARLQHPHIVQIYEIGEHSGQPYLALEFVEGGSLDRRLTGTPLPPHEASGLVETLARAVHFAHECGIIHRDLKPANVLLTTETQRHREDKDREKEPKNSSLCLGASVVNASPKITDFGLAKLVDAAAQTQTGDVLGTPSYMAPEQAAGLPAKIGPGTDVYALGAILYELLTGRPPFRGVSILDTLDQVRTREPVPPLQLQPRLPRDLDVICLKCLAKEPARRYPTALALADDLRRFQAGEPIQARPVRTPERLWRWCRRNPVLATVSGLACLAALIAVIGPSVSLILLRQEQGRTQAALEQARANETEAQENFRLARDAVDRLHTRLSQERLLNEPGMEPLRKELLQTALEFYQEFAQRYQHDPNRRDDLGNAWRRLAAITSDIGSGPEARQLALQAVHVLEELVQAHPGVPAYQSDLAAAVHNEGLFAQNVHDAKTAEAAYQRARDLRQRLLQAAPDNPQYQRDLGATLQNLGSLYQEMGRTQDALAVWQRAATLREPLARHAANAEDRNDLAGTYVNLGYAFHHLGQPQRAEQQFAQASRLLSQLTRERPEVAAYQRALAACCTNQTALYLDLRQTAKAEEKSQEAHRLRERLVREHPTVLAYQSELATSHVNRAVACNRRKETGQAETHFQAALVILDGLSTGHPDVPYYRRYQGIALEYLAMLYQERRQYPEADQTFRRALALRETLAREHPEIPDYPIELGATYSALGGLRAQQGQPQESLAWQERAVKCLQAALTAHPGQSQGRYYLSLAWARQGEALTALHRPAEGVHAWDLALAADATTDPAPLHTGRALALVRAGHSADAVAAAEAALKVPAGDDNLYDLACVFAAAAGAMGSEDHAGRAVRLLEQARQAGRLQSTEARTSLLRDADLDGLRQRPDFQRLLAGLGISKPARPRKP